MPRLSVESKIVVLLVAVCVLSTGCSGHQRHAAPSVVRQKHALPVSGQIYSIATDGSQLHSLNVAGSALARGPGGRIAFLQGPWPFKHGSRLAVMHDDGSRLRLLGRIDQGRDSPEPPSWSPGGQRIALANGSDGCAVDEPCGQWRTSVIDVQTGQRQSAIPEADLPTWSPDGRAIAFANIATPPAAPGEDYGPSFVYAVATGS